MNRVLEVLTLCNQTLFHAENEESLLDTICEIIVSKGGYRFALIGFSDAESDSGFRVATWKGYESGYIKDAFAAWNAQESMNCPLIKTLKTGKPAIENDLTHVARPSPCYEAAFKRGIRSLLTLPLKSDDGRSMGVFAIYSILPNAFDKSESELLSELGDDLSYCIQSLRTKKTTIAAQNALRDNEEKYRTLFETMAQGIVYQSDIGEIISANPAALKILGLSLDQLQGRSSMDPRWRTICEDGTEYPGEAHPAMVALKTGREIRNAIMGVFNPELNMYRWLLINAIPQFRYGQLSPYQVYASFDDITEIKTMQERLERLSGEMKAIIDAAPLAIFDIDTESNVRSIWNAAAERIFGWKSEEVIGKPLPIVPDDKKEEFIRIHDRLLDGESFSGIELCRVRKDGVVIDISSATAPLRDRHENIIGIMVIAADITENNKLKQQFLHAQKMEAVGRLAGGMAHDFNNLLTVIMGNTSMLLLDFTQDDPRYEMLQEINNTAQRAALLTRQLLTFSRKQIVELRIVDINTVLENMSKLLNRLIGEDVELVIKPFEDIWPVRVDVGQIEQVVTNLVVNARDALPSGGRIIIETSNTELDATDEVDWKIGNTRQYALISVSDNGIGMDKQTVDHIFEPFFTTKEPGKGTGLGLTTCYGIIRQSDGFIRVYSEPGSGTVIKILLPRYDGSVETDIPFKSAERGYSGRGTILLVEDEPGVRQAASRMLKQLGYTIIEAANGEEGLEVADKYGIDRIDLLLTDMVMPKMGGKELADAIVARNPAIRTMFMSGYAGASISNNDFLKQGTLFVQKPFTQKSLSKKIRDILS